MKINNNKNLPNIVSNHSADIAQIYRECTREPFNTFRIDTTLPASNPLKFRKKSFDSLLI